MNTLGIVLIALGIFISVCLHEAGHMLTAKAFGMKVTRYFAGFGPTLFSFRRGETEYGLKAIPLGGFVKIVGMTPQDDDVEPADEKRAMWRFPVWKRTIVMSAGSVTHFLLAFIALWISGMTIGFANPAVDKFFSQPDSARAAYISTADCVQKDLTNSCDEAKDGASPAKAGGLRSGDQVLAINGASIASWTDLSTKIRTLPAGQPAAFTIDRPGSGVQTLTVTPVTAKRPPLDDQNGTQTDVTVIGIGAGVPAGLPLTVKYGPIDSIGQSGVQVKNLAINTWQSLAKFPEKIPKLWTAITGGQRDPETPVSVVGVSRIGGEAAAAGAWPIVIALFIGLNFFVGVFNLLPLLPLDGGHIAVAWFEKVRSWFYRRLGKPDPGRVDYTRLMPITYAFILLFGGLTLLTVTADIVNPITLFK
jgi:membrane-associated protease RseP (regulator of RpoE activity)